MACAATAAAYVVETEAGGKAGPIVPFLRSADLGLQAAFAGCLRAPEVRRLVQTCEQSRAALAAPSAGCCCPHLEPRSGGVLAAALLGCSAPQVKSLRPLGDFDSAAYLPELALRLSSLGHLEELGPVSVDTECEPLLVPSSEGACPAWVAEVGRGGLEITEFETESGRRLQSVTVRSLLPVLAEGFARCRVLAELDLTIACTGSSSARSVADHLLPALGRCHALRALRLDLDATLECGGTLMAGVARLLECLASSAAGVLEHLSLGYLWWSEASEETLARMRVALKALCDHRGGGLRELVVRYPQDQELGAMDALCSTIEGVASDVEEVCLVEAWGEDGEGRNALVRALATCPRLRRVDILGFIPQAVDQRSMTWALHREWVGTDRDKLPELLFNTPGGWKRAAKSAPSVSERQKLFPSGFGDADVGASAEDGARESS